LLGDTITRYRVILLVVVGVILCGTLLDPGFTHFSSHLNGERSDLKASLWKIWILESGRIQEGRVRLVNFPDGFVFPVSPYRSVVDPVLQITSRLIGELQALNLFLLISSISAFILMSYVIYEMTEDWIAAGLGGLAFFLLPSRLAVQMHYLYLGRAEIIALHILMAIRFMKSDTHCRGALFGGTQLLSFAVDVYIGAFCALITLCFAGSSLLGRTKMGRTRWRRRLLWAGILTGVAIACGGARYSFEVATHSERLGTSVSQLSEYAAGWADYFLPSTNHPLLGFIRAEQVPSIVGTSLGHLKELYFGWIMIIFGVIGIWKLLNSSRTWIRNVAVALSVTAFASIAFSTGIVAPLLHNYSPSYYLHRLFPLFRVPSRFGLVACTSVVVFAGVGISVALGRVRWRIVTGGAIAILVLFEFCSVPSLQFEDLHELPDVYQNLVTQNGVDALAEYPLCFPPEVRVAGPSYWDFYDYLAWQRMHGRPLFNGEPQNQLNLALKRELADPGAPSTPARLRWLGVSHLIIHIDRLSDATVERVRRHEALQLVYSDATAEMYQIVGESIFLDPSAFMFPRAIKRSVGDSGDVNLLVERSTQESTAEELLVYGPYMALGKGDYDVEVLVSVADTAEGRVKISVTSDGGANTLEQLEVAFAEGVAPVHIRFTTDGTIGVEFRVHGGSGSYLFEGIELKLVSAANAT
jgi:hypothetical protein